MAIHLTFGYPAGILIIVKIEFGPALSENSMRAATDSDPEIVKVRNGDALSERIRERLTEESLLYILLLWHWTADK